MSHSRSFAGFGVLTQDVFFACLLLCGCEQSERIEKYTVPKYESLQTTAFLADRERRRAKPEPINLEPERMIGVIVPQSEVMWFFKLQGKVDEVANRESDVRKFLNSVRFPAPEKIDWTLPANWRQFPSSEMRYATLILDGEPSLEISVTKLRANPDAPISEQVLANINRWRNQLSLPPMEDADLPKHCERLNLADSPAFMVNLVGRPKAKPAGTAQPRRPVEPADNHNEDVPVYDLPQGWVEGRAGRFAVLAFQASDDNRKVLITVTPAAGGRLNNVNRWRDQVRLAPLSDAEVEASAKKVKVGRREGEQFDVTNEGRTIFGVIVEERGQTWFIKLDGDAALAEQERAHFEEFLKSLKWN